MSLEEPIEEDLKDKKVAQDSDKEAQEIMRKLVIEAKLNKWWIYPNGSQKSQHGLRTMCKGIFFGVFFSGVAYLWGKKVLLREKFVSLFF